MAEIVVPSWADLDEVIKAASTDLLICSPFYSAEGLGHIERNVSGTPTIRFRVRLSPSDWAAGVSDPEALLILVDLLRSRHCDVEIGVNQRLHAKAYAANDSLLLLGSSNLTGGGFGNNIELMIRMRDQETIAAMVAVSAGLLTNLRLLTFDQLHEWVDAALPSIVKAREMNRQDDEVTELLVPVQAELDSLLGYGKGGTATADPDEDDLDTFVAWLKDHASLPGADMLIQRKVHNLQRLSGKFNQSFYGSLRFLTERPEYIDRLASSLDGMASDDIYAFDDTEISAAWTHHLDEHALDRTASYSYPTLRGYLAPQLGGTLTGGGGGGSTLKRMLPLVGRYLKERGTGASGGSASSR